MKAHKNTEKALHDANMLLQKTLDSLNEAVFIVQTGSRIILDVNLAVEQMFGYRRSEILGESTACLHLNNEMFRQFSIEMLAAYDEKGFFETTFKMRRKDGTTFDSEHRVTPIRDEQGQITCHVCVVRDISERIKAEAVLAEKSRVLEELNTTLEDRVHQAVTKLHQSENLRNSQNRLLIDLAPEAIIVFNVDLGTITDANANALKLFGCCREELFGTTPLSFYPATQPDGLSPDVSFGQNCARVLAGEVLTLERSLINRQGRKLLCEVNLVRMPATDSQLVRASFIDITERKRMEEDLARALAIERNLNEEQRQFFGLISHELRTPLSIIDGAAQLLQLSACPDSECLRLAQRIRSASTRLTSLVDTCLTEERIESSGWVPAKNNVSLSALVEEVAALFRKTSDKHLIQTAVGELPATYCCDVALLKILLGNLLENAIKYSPHGGTIRVRCGTDGVNSVRLEVSDHGIGFAPEHAEKIFDRFFRTWEVPDIPGAGLGLHLVRKIAKLHGGDVSGASIPGHGSTFTVKLPLLLS